MRLQAGPVTYYFGRDGGQALYTVQCMAVAPQTAQGKTFLDPSNVPKTQQELDERCKRCLLQLGWRHPFFLPPASYVRMTLAPVGTACVDISGHIRIDPMFLAQITDAQLAGILAHELCHLMFLHGERCGNRDPKRFNRASDRAINQGLKEAGIELIPGCLYPGSGQENWSAEDLYEVEDTQQGGGGGGKRKKGGGAGIGQSSGDGDDGRPQVGAGCGVDPAPAGVEQIEGKTVAEYQRQWREVRAQAANSARSRGHGAGDALARILEMPPARVKWSQILRNSCARALMAHGRDDQCWMRRNRRSGAEGPQFPGWTAYKAQVAVVIDTSGSMSDEDLAEAVSNTVAIAKSTGVRIFVVVHDYVVHFAGWIQGANAPKVQSKLVGRGGTDFKEAYKRVGDAGKFDAMVHLTDGECEWAPRPQTVKRLVVALLGSRQKAHIPKNDPMITMIDATL